MFQSKPTLFERIRDQWRPQSQLADWSFLGPTLLSGNEEAAAVLRELREDPSPMIRDYAKIGLGVHPDFSHAGTARETTRFRFVAWDIGGKAP